MGDRAQNWAAYRAVFGRTWRKVWQRPVVLTFSFVQPLLWMAFFGFLFHRFPLGPEHGDLSYLSFLLPGICAMTVLFGASQSGILFIRDLQTGFLGRMLNSPASPQMILGGKTAADTSRLLLQACGVLLLGLLLGARLSLPSSGALEVVHAVFLSLVALVLLGGTFCYLSCWIALRTRAQESMAVFVHTINMPVLFTSSALVPRRQMPEWLDAVSRLNPLTWTVEELRHHLLGLERPSSALPGWALMLGLILLFVLVVMPRQLRRAALDSEVIE